VSLFGSLTSIDLASLVLRLAVGGLMILHGWPKIKDMKRPAAWIASTRWKWAAGFAYPFSLLEFLGGVTLVIGFLTRIAALLFVLEMIATTIFARAELKKKLLGGWETDILFLAGALALVLIGAGAWSLDALLGL
jgi:uncharacterized membrane protein YphA (DoxX/SURF4 family)